MAKRAVSILLMSAIALSIIFSGVSHAEKPSLSDLGLDENGRFIETRFITVEVFDRGQEDGKTHPENNYWSQWIHDKILAELNIDVTFDPISRWNEQQDIVNRLAAGNAPDVCYTYNYPAILNQANAGGILDLAEYIDNYQDLMTNLWDWLKDEGLNYNRDPETGAVWAIEGRRSMDGWINAFMREDWLTKLGMQAPTNLEELEAVLYAFRDNAQLLLGDEADQMVPFSLGADVSYRLAMLYNYYMPADLSDKDLYVTGFDDRHFLLPNFKEAVRLANKWYNEGLIWHDFYLYPFGSTDESDKILKTGYAGMWMMNYDSAYRVGDGYLAAIQEKFGPDAQYIVLEAFQNLETGKYTKFMDAAVGTYTKIFLPETNDEPLASLMYLDWITKPENRAYLQIGEEGVNHIIDANGNIKSITATGEMIANSLQNIDYTMTVNGYALETYDATMGAFANGYACEPSYIINALETARHDGFTIKHFNFGEIVTEAGMKNALDDQRNAMLAEAVTAPVANFDAVYDRGLATYMDMGGQAIKDERTAKWEARYGDAVNAN